MWYLRQSADALSNCPSERMSPPSEPQLRLSVPLPPLPPGSYRLRWRALSRDGHVVPGEIRFSIAP